MANEFCEILIDVRIVDNSLRISPAAFTSSAGAVVEFFGVVRGLEEEKNIAGIYYEAHREMALHQLRKIARSAREKFGFEQLVLHHRIGFVPVAEPSLFVRVTAKHRGAAFDACEWIIEQLKAVVPIWKEPRFAARGSDKSERKKEALPETANLTNP